MLSIYVALLVGAISASLISRDNLRGIFWIVIGQVAFWASLFYIETNNYFPFLFSAACNSLIVLLICKYGKYIWEKWLMALFALCAFGSLVAQAFNYLTPNFDLQIHGWCLYFINWIVILYIGSISGLVKVNDGKNYSAFAFWYTPLNENYKERGR